MVMVMVYLNNLVKDFINLQNEYNRNSVYIGTLYKNYSNYLKTSFLKTSNKSDFVFFGLRTRSLRRIRFPG